MKILYISAIEENAGWGAEYFIHEAMLTLGHEVICLDYRRHRNHLADKLLKIKDIDFDILLLQRGEWFPIELIKAINRPKVFWASELFNHDQERLIYSGVFDTIFLHSSNRLKSLKREWNMYSGKPYIYNMINGFDPNVFYQDRNVKKDIDVLFVGTLTDRRKKWLNEISKNNKVTYKSVYGKEMALYINRAKIVLNIHSYDQIDTETRVFECLGCGAFLISEELSDENPFIKNEHYIETNINMFSEKIEYYLNNENKRKEIAEAGYNEAKNNHTYLKRTKYICELLEKTRLKNNYIGPAINKNIILKFKENFGTTCSRIKKYIDEIPTDEKIVIYCAGEHTKKLLQYTSLKKKNIECIVDKEYEKIREFDGYRVHSPKYLENNNEIKMVLISSFSFQEEIEENLLNKLKFKGAIVRLYCNFDKSAFYRDETDLTSNFCTKLK